MRSKVSSPKPSSSKLSAGYHPSEDEEFMNSRQLEYFRQKLLRWRAELLAESSETLQHLKEESLLKPDITDRASLETERAIGRQGARVFSRLFYGVGLCPAGARS